MVRILIVGGSGQDPAPYRSCLEGGGFEVVVASSVGQARALLGQQSFDRVLLDPSLAAQDALVDALLRPPTERACVLLMDRESRCIGMSERCAEAFAAFRIGERLDAIEGGLLGGLAELLREGRADSECVLELEDPAAGAADGAADGSSLSVHVQPLQDADCVCLRFEVGRRRPPATAPGSSGYRIHGLAGDSPAIRGLLALVDRLRCSPCPVLIHGETGSGKEQVARALHFDGPRADRSFTPLHCGAIGPERIETHFAATEGGTVYLDEVGAATPAEQAVLLRLLRPALDPHPVGPRILAATSRDLAALVAAGALRADLYYRLDVVALHLPPLRARREDLPLLVAEALDRSNVRHGRLADPVRGLSAGALAVLMAYSWPGNLRELENTIDRALSLGSEGTLRTADLPDHIRVAAGYAPPSSPPALRTPSPLPAPDILLPRPGGDDDGSPKDWSARRDESTRRMIVEALLQARGNKVAARATLDLPKSTFYRYLKRFDLGGLGVDGLRRVLGGR